jgi:hypothetical protein
MADLTYDDFKRRINIQDLLVDAGYRLNRRDGLRYPSYVRLDSDGRRVHGDKFIVTANGLCCFQPPERKNYNVISFIKEHPQLFADYRPGMSTDRLVNLVCNRLLNHPIEERPQQTRTSQAQAKVFDVQDYECQSFRVDDWESQKSFYPYFKHRGIDLQTQRAFADHFFLASQVRTDGKKYTNLAFPLSLAAQPGKEIVGLEERSRPNAEGKTAYKGMAAGSNAAEGLWIGRLENHRSDQGFSAPIGQAKDVYWFESALDAMAFYQLNRKTAEVGNAVFVSTGGSPSNRQFSSLMEQTPEAVHHLCFDRDRAGQMFAINFALQLDKRVFTSYLSANKEQLIINDMTEGFQRHELPLEDFDFHGMCDKLKIDRSRMEYLPCDARYKDWNDELLDKPMEQTENQQKGVKR